MGMSASQARLLALEARQSNLEYQGQQINQARTVLSQQCTALYNSLLDMQVPTPPVTTDFQTVQYKGYFGASPFTIGDITPAGDGVYDVDLKYTKNGNCVSVSSRPEITVYNEPKTLKGGYVNNDETFNKPATTISYYTAIPNEKTTYEDLTYDERDKYPNNTVVMHSVTVNADDEDDGTKYEYYYQTDGGKFVKADSFEDAETKGGQGSVFAKVTVGEIKNIYGDEESLWNSENCFDYVMSNLDEKTETTGGFTLDAVSSQNFYDTSGEKPKLITNIKEYLTEVGTNAQGETVYTFENPSIIFKASELGTQEIKNPKYEEKDAKRGVSVDGYTLEDFSKETLGDKYESIAKSIANSFPEYKIYDKDGKVVGYDYEGIEHDFKVIYKNGTPCFVKTAELDELANRGNYNGQGRVDLYSLEANGEYTETKNSKGCKLGFDTNGRISYIEIPVKDSEGNLTGNYEKVDLTPETVVDDTAYNDAVKKYEYENYLYDQKNKEINAKTEIIQQEDRNLELKLQRLDNERTQITTEIEAVQKVIKDNIEKSYKTFNG